MKHFTSIFDLSLDELTYLIDLSKRLKDQHQTRNSPQIEGKPVLGLFFEKPSLRTRLSFESAMNHIGGSSLFFSKEECGIGKRESIYDFARVVSSYVDLIAIRTFSQDVVELLAKYSTCPVINALTDRYHPCQALADAVTITDRFDMNEQLKIVFIGDGNNVARSLAAISVQLGFQFVLSSPKDYQFDAEFLEHPKLNNAEGTIEWIENPKDAVAEAHVVYTDVWTSMGQEIETDIRKDCFQDYQVNPELMKAARKDACFMHCLPAHRGEEVTDKVIDSDQSVVIQQAENRMHAQKALILWLLHSNHMFDSDFMIN